MPFNPNLFPADFSDTDDELTIEKAVETLNIQAIDTARRQAHTRRIGGQNAIANRTRLVPTRPIRMPLFQIGAVRRDPPSIGTAGFLGGGRGGTPLRIFGISESMYEVLFSNETFKPVSMKMTRSRAYVGTVGNQEAGVFAGGHFNKLDNSIDQVTYRTRTVFQLSQQLSAARIAIAGGMNNRQRGVLAGGLSSGARQATRNGERITFGSLFGVTSLGTFLSAPRASMHNGFSSLSFGYIWSGHNSIGWSGINSAARYKNIVRVNLSSIPETQTTIATVLTDQTHIVHACFSNPVKAYVAGGVNDAPVPYVTESITGFIFSGETAFVLSATLPDKRICADGIGSSVAGYVVGGDTPASIAAAQAAKIPVTGTRDIIRLTYANETCRKLGSQLARTEADQGALSDYSPGFSH